MPVTVDVVIPVLNEERAPPGSVGKLRAFLDTHPGRDWRIVIADNGSTDGTPEIARDLARSVPSLSVARLEQRGRGRALKKTWAESTADVCCYMDVDLSTGLDALPLLVNAVAEEGFDVAIGSRLLPGSEVVGRTLKREVTSRGYSLLFRTMFGTVFRDAQCGFKAIRTDVARAIVPLVADIGWFFDTELLIIAQRSGYRIREIPVHWEDDPDTRVKVFSTAWEDVKGLLRLRFGGVPKAPRTPG